MVGLPFEGLATHLAGHLEIVPCRRLYSKESTASGTELPGLQDTPANFALREKLLSRQESALLKLLGQVQNCDSGKEWGLELFSQLLPSTRLPKRGDAKERISAAVRNYLGQIIYSDRFLRKVVNKNEIVEPLHYSKYICNALSKELGFPIKFDPDAGIASDLQKKTAQELLEAAFEEAKPPSCINASSKRSMGLIGGKRG